MKKGEQLITKEHAVAQIELARKVAVKCDAVTYAVEDLLAMLVAPDGRLEISPEMSETFIKFVEAVRAIHEDAYSRHLSLLPVFQPWSPEYIHEESA